MTDSELIALKNRQLAECTKVMCYAAEYMEEVAKLLDQTGYHMHASDLRDDAEALLKAREGNAPMEPQYADSAFDEYRKAAERTRPTDSSFNDYIANAALGLAGETGELVDAVKKELFHGKPYKENQAKVLDEAGDVLFYLDWLAGSYGLTLQEVANHNINKLKARYPKGFVPGGGNR